MFDIDTGKLLIVAVLALIVIGPKDLPRVMRQVGQAVGKLRRMSAQFQGQFMDAIKDAEIDDIRRELKDLESTAGFNPARDIQAEVSSLKTEIESAVQTVDAAGSVPSPAEGFVLPPVPDAVRLEAERDSEIPVTLLAEGVGPAIFEEEAAETATRDCPKRKLFAKPRRSRFVRVNSDRTAERTGQAIAVRQRLVRARKSVSQDVLTS